MAQRLHTLVQHTDDEDSGAATFELFAQIIDDMRGTAAAPSRDLDVQRAQARREIVTRALFGQPFRSLA